MAKMLRTSSSTTSTLRPATEASLWRLASSDRLGAFGQLALDAVEEQRGLAEQALGRMHARS